MVKTKSEGGGRRVEGGKGIADACSAGNGISSFGKQY